MSCEADDDAWLGVLAALISNGADVNAKSPYGETALDQCFARSAFAAIRLRITHGADHSSFEWSESDLRIVMGDLPEPKEAASALMTRNAGPFVCGAAAQMIMAGTSKLLPAFLQQMDDTMLTPARAAHQPEMLRLLAQQGVPLEGFDSENIAVGTGADRTAETTITPEMFNRQAMPGEGRSNPEHADIPFWREQIRTGRSGYSGEIDRVGERKYHCHGTPVWSFERFGRTGTRLPDGRSSRESTKTVTIQTFASTRT